MGLQECVKACSPANAGADSAHLSILVLAASREGSNLVTSPIVRIAPVALAVALLIPLGVRAQDSECVSCHSARYASFPFDERAHFDDWRESIHAAAGVGCTACHGGNPEAEFPETRGVESVCAFCHGPGRSVPMSEYQTQVRLMRELVEIDRRDLVRIREAIEHVQDPDTRQSLAAAYGEAEVALAAATAAWHAFTFDSALEPLARVGEQVSELLERLGLR